MRDIDFTNTGEQNGYPCRFEEALRLGFARYHYENIGDEHRCNVYQCGVRLQACTGLASLTRLLSASLNTRSVT